MAVRFSNLHISVQFIDDIEHKTLATATSVGKKAQSEARVTANVAGAKKIGALAAQAAKSAGITAVVFDRCGARFHGKVKALADAAREGGLQF